MRCAPCTHQHAYGVFSQLVIMGPSRRVQARGPEARVGGRRDDGLRQGVGRGVGVVVASSGSRADEDCYQHQCYH